MKGLDLNKPVQTRDGREARIIKNRVLNSKGDICKELAKYDYMTPQTLIAASFIIGNCYIESKKGEGQ